MAITKLKPIKKTLNVSINYITDCEKTSKKSLENILVSTFNCSLNSADFDFTFTQNLAKQVKGDYSKNGGNNILAWHIIQSFSPNDNITPKQAHTIGKELANDFLKEKYEYVLATHIDKNHLHNHIIFNATSFENLKKFRVEKNLAYLELRKISNNICEKYMLSTLDYPNRKINNNKNIIEADVSKKDKSFKNILKDDIDKIIIQSIDFNNFLVRMKNLGYNIKEDKNGFAFKNIEQKYYTRLSSLGEKYNKKNIEEFIKNNKSVKHKLEQTPKKIYNININSIDELINPKDIMKANITFRAKLKYCIDYYIFKSKNFDEFLQGMKDTGYSIKYGKHISFRCKGMDKNIRAKVLGDDYTEERIKERIAEVNKVLPNIPFIEKKRDKNIGVNKEKISIKSLIDINNNKKAKTSIAYKKFSEKYNAEQTVATMNFMREHNYNDETLQIAIERIQKDIMQNKKDLMSIENDFKKLKSIKRTEKNAKDYDEALANLNRLKNKLNKILKDNNTKLLEHKTVQKNRSLRYNKNNNRNL